METEPKLKSKKFWGAAGTGKTTALLHQLKLLKKQGYDFNDITFCTFTESMAETFNRRVFDKFALGEYKKKDAHEFLKYFATIHGVCHRLISEIEGAKEVVDNGDKKKFCEKHHLDFEDNEDYTSDKVGNRFFAIKSWLTNTLRPMTACRRFPHKQQMSVEVYQMIFDWWKKYKEDNNLVDFDDMLLKVNESKITPPTRVLLVDEFQDLSPLQYEIYKRWRDSSELVYIAGDPYQAIYSFQGCTPDFFINEPLDCEVLSSSIRLGKYGWEFARNILQAYRMNAPKIEPLGDDVPPKTMHIRQLSRNVLPHSNTFILTHTKYMATEIGKMLREDGVVFSGRKAGGWTEKMKAIYDSMLMLIKKDGGVYADEWKIFLGCLKKPYVVPKKKDLEGMYVHPFVTFDKVPQYIPALSLTNILHNPFDFSIFTNTALRKEKKQADENEGSGMEKTIISALKNKNATFFTGSEVYVGTIHSKKGGEADNVFVLDSISPIAFTNMFRSDESSKEIARMFYVACTRHRKNLYIVSDPDSPYRFKLLENICSRQVAKS